MGVVCFHKWLPVSLPPRLSPQCDAGPTKWLMSIMRYAAESAIAYVVYCGIYFITINLYMNSDL